MARYICIHGHFYQPPRENPWLDEVELQDSAYPFHDWNEKITAQCYSPNAASRILNSEQKIIQIVNNYSKMSFNFGPTLLSWLERHRPDTYEAVLEADRLSRSRFSGHGSALAQVYNHMIMPLANKRDKVTQVIWGIEDFKRRFGRDPEGMWLPETAVDTESLETLAEFGIRFTVLAPGQARRVRRIPGGADWEEVEGARIDPSTVYLCQLPSGKSINLFFYDGPISREIAFAGLLANGQALAERLISAFSDSRDCAQLVHTAVDGETFGHHQQHGDMALAYCLHFIESKNIARLTNYGEFLERHPPIHLVEIIENSSWSCIHGIDRWRENCGCHSGMHPGWTQAWRGPLRNALDWLRDTSAHLFEGVGSRFLLSPWEARQRYLEVILDRSRANVDRFLARHTSGELSHDEKVTVLRLLEMQRNAMLMYTSCGWFFDEISGIESVQILQYAARVVQFVTLLSEIPAEAELVARLKAAPSNLYGDGAKVYELLVKPARLDLLRVGVHYAVSSLFEDYSDEMGIYCYTVRRERHDTYEAGKLRLAIGRAKVNSNITWSEKTVSYAVLHLGDHNISGGVRRFKGDDAYAVMESEIRAAFDRADVPEVIRLTDKHFRTNSFSLWHLFRDEQRKVIDQILALTYNDVEASFRRVFDGSHAVMNFLKELRVPLPKFFLVAAERIVNLDLMRLFEVKEMDHARLESLITIIKRLQLELDRELLGFKANEWITCAMERLQKDPEERERMEEITGVLRLLSSVDVVMDLWRPQNIYFSLGESIYPQMKSYLEKQGQAAEEWVRCFEELGNHLNVTMP